MALPFASLLYPCDGRLTQPLAALSRCHVDAEIYLPRRPPLVTGRREAAHSLSFNQTVCIDLAMWFMTI